MAKTPLDEAVAKWNRIAAQAASQGIPHTAFQQLGNDDIARVAQGHQGMSQEEAMAAVAAAIGRPPILPQARKTNGPLAVLGNAPHDIEDIVRGLNPLTIGRNIYRDAAALPHFDWGKFTSKQGDPALGYKDVSHAGLLSQFAESARRDASIPLIRMLPGLHTLAAATTSEGRKSLEQHPVGTALDVLPVAGALTKMAGLAAGEGSVAEALQENHPLKAVARALPDQLTAPIGAKTTDILRTLKLDPETRSLWRAKSEADTAALNKANEFVTKHITPMVEAMSEEERVLLYHEMTNPAAFPDPLPEHAAIINQVRSLNETLGRQGEALGKLHPLIVGDRLHFYSTEGGEGRVVEGLSKSEYHQKRLESATAELKTTQSRIAKRSENLQALVERDMARIKELQFQGTGARLRQAQQRMYRNQEKLKSLAHDETLLKRQAKVTKRLAKVHSVNGKLMKNFIRNAPAEYHPMLAAEIESRARIKATGMYGQGSPELESALKRLDQGDYSKIYNPDEWKQITNEVRSTWTKFIAMGLDPVWVHSVREHQFGAIIRAVPLAERYVTPASVRAKAFNLAPRLTDAAVGLTATASEYIRTFATEELIATHVKPYLMTEEDINAALQPQLARELKHGIDPMKSTASTLDRLRVQDYEKFDPAAQWSFTTPKLTAMAKEGNLYLPKHIANAVREMTRPQEVSTLGHAARRTTAIFKTSVLAFSPRYMAHTLFGGATMLLLRGHWDDWTSMREAVQYARNPMLFPSAVSHGLDQLSADQIFHEAAGNTMGTIWSKIAGPEKGLYKAHEFVANFQRAMAYLGGVKKAARGGASDEMAMAAGIEHANKIFVDWNGFTPIERTIVRQVFPFYAFTRHILGYVLTYPIDHPLRAAILSNFAENEQKDWDSGLPKTFQNLFYLGQPDKNGNVRAIDTRTLNPFRDVANYFTLRGFFSSIHPVAQTFLEAGGVNPLTGSPQLYSNLAIDEATGKLVARRPDNLGLRFIENIIPEVGAVDHYVQATNSLRTLKTTNPTAYRKQLFNSLNIPFVPYSYNLPAIRGKDEMTRFRLAQQLVSQAESSNKWGEAERFNAVPYNGGMVDPGTLAAAWERAIHQLQGTAQAGDSPKAVLPKPRARRAR